MKNLSNRAFTWASFNKNKQIYFVQEDEIINENVSENAEFQPEYDEFQNLEKIVSTSKTQKKLENTQKELDEDRENKLLTKSKESDEYLQRVYKKEALITGGENYISSRIEHRDRSSLKAKEALSNQHEEFKLIYLSTEQQKAFLDTVEDFYSGETFLGLDLHSGLVGMFNQLLDNRFSSSLEEKLKKEGFNLSKKEIKQSLETAKKYAENNQKELETIISEEARIAGMSLEEYKSTPQYKTAFKDFVVSILGLAVGIGSGVSTELSLGLSVPIIHTISGRRRLISMNLNEIVASLREGESYTEVLENCKSSLDKAVFATFNIMKSAECLAGGKMLEGVSDDVVAEKYYDYQRLQKQLKFNPKSFSTEGMADKNLYESIGLVLQERGEIVFEKTDKLKNILYSWTERFPWLGSDDKEEDKFENCLEILETELEDDYTEKDIVDLNQKKVAALKSILDLIKKENNEDKLHRKYENETEEFNRLQAEQEISRMYRVLDDMARKQQSLYRIKNIETKDKNLDFNTRKRNALYKNALVSVLETFTSADELLHVYPSVDFETQQALYKYYDPQTEWNAEFLDKIIATKGFERWSKNIVSKLKADVPVYAPEMSAEKLAKDKNLNPENINKSFEEYLEQKAKYNPAATIAPRAGTGVPITGAMFRAAYKYLDKETQTTTTSREVTTSSKDSGSVFDTTATTPTTTKIYTETNTTESIAWEKVRDAVGIAGVTSVAGIFVPTEDELEPNKKHKTFNKPDFEEFKKEKEEKKL